MNYLIVFLGAGLGGAARHGVNVLVPRLFSGSFPLHTLIINVLGSFLMGVLTELFALKVQLPAEGRLFLTTGVLGGFTTFSTFSLDAGLLYERGDLSGAALYVGASVALSIAGLFAGLGLIRQFAG